MNRSAFALAAALLVTACAPTNSSTPTAPSAEATASTTTSAAARTPAPTPEPTRAPDEVSSLAPIPPGDFVTDLDVPWGLARLGDGSLLVTEKDTGNVIRVAPGGQKTTIAQIPVNVEFESGLLGLAVHPEDETQVFLYFSAGSDNRVVRYRLEGDRLTEDRVIVDGIPQSQIHNGGRLAFGPDGFLYISTGDGGSSSNSQNQNSLGGKILRVDADGNPAPGNPFHNRVWSLGHRNVQGLAWDDQGTMYASEFGQNTWDELNRIEPGKNYGWPVVEGMGDDPAYMNPLRVWRPRDASPSGLAYLEGNLYMAALRGESLWRIPVAGGEPQRLFEGEYGRLRTVEPTGDGQLFVVTSNRFRGDPKPGDDRIIVWRP